jgi:5-methylcytosine-specific restriction protein A
MKIPNTIIPDVYQISKKVYNKELTLTEGSDILSNKHNMNVNSARDYIHNYRGLMEGKKFKRTLNAYSMEYLIREIGNDYGAIQLEKAISALKQHIEYYEGNHNGSLNKLRAIAKKYSKSCY